MTESYLSKMIRKNLGLTFSELVSLRRCEEASRLLCLTDKTMDQIALDVGFSGRNHLSKQFQKWFKCIPTDYRNRVLEELMQEIDLREKGFLREEADAVLDTFLEGV